MMLHDAVTNIELSLPKVASGKVREMFDLGDDGLLLVASDRISAFDVVMREGIPDKGRVLTAMSVFWFDFLHEICPNHLISTELPSALAGHRDLLAGRAMVVRKLEMLPVEFVVRGYLAGSGWKDYQDTGSVCGVPLPSGLKESDRLPEPIFTPATKATTGHDLNISEDEAAELCGPAILKIAKVYALRLYIEAARHASDRGIVLADTKFEFGLLDGEVILGDEVLTPDSSRFWPQDSWLPGATAPSFDKQPLRDWLDGTGWSHDPPPPELPPEVIEATRHRYIEAYERITGSSLQALTNQGV